jgi:hypothetical protein
MKQINQQVEVAFHAIEFKEALAMVPLMDSLINDINIDTYNRVLGENRKNYKWVSKRSHFTAHQTRQMYDVLVSLGFVDSGAQKIIPENEIIAFYNPELYESEEELYKSEE